MSPDDKALNESEMSLVSEMEEGIKLEGRLSEFFRIW
jgi:hypothetical protein